MTIIQLFENSVAQHTHSPLLWEKSNGLYQPLTYQQTQQQIIRFAAGLASLGLTKGDRVGLLAEGRNDWFISEMAVFYNRAINVPLSVKLEADNEMVFRINHSECRFLICSKQQLIKIRKLIDQLTNIEKIIVLDEVELTHAKEISKKTIYQFGDEFLKADPIYFDNIKKDMLASDVVNICYTSGTTADPKGIMLSHRNYTANVEQAFSYIDIPTHYKTLAILPWDHSFAHTACLFAFMSNGASIASVQVGENATETIRNISTNIAEIQPHIMMSVPALAKNFKKGIEKGIADKGKVTQILFNTAINTAYIYNGNGLTKGKGLRFLLKPLVALWDKILFSKIRTKFGGHLQYFIGGGALLDIDLQKFFYAIGIPMYQGYGLSEASPIISANTPLYHKMGSSGKVVNNLEIKICDTDGKELPLGESGEIVIRGENVMLGYWRNDEATAKTIIDGWLYTGDLGWVDKDNYLYVLGRFKSLLIGADGEKYSPEGIEEALLDHSPYIEQIMLHNNQNAYTTALIVPCVDAIKKYCAQHKLDINQPKTWDAIIELINHDINHFKHSGKINHHFPQRWLPTTFIIASDAFSESNKLLNSTMKLVRNKVLDYFKSDIDFLVSADAKNIKNDINRKNLQAILKLK